MNAFTDLLKTDRLMWLPELGVGYFPVKEAPYDAAYWQRYQAMDKTPAADYLNANRCNMVHSWAGGKKLVDIGIGGGRFVQEQNCYGYDINPHAVEWLKQQGKYLDPYVVPVEAATFWDSLEHIHDPRPLLENVTDTVFVSMPIYQHANHILRSKHFRKDEHCWYFTRRGFKWYMRQLGFTCVEWSTMEQPLREDIETFVFTRFR